MIIRLATTEDLDELDRVYDSARAYMRATGNYAQWSAEYPSRVTHIADMDAGELYVIEEGGTVHAAFVLMHEPEPAYATIDGAWVDDDVPYATLHRVASDGCLRGVLKTAVQLGLQDMPSLRIDTHADNAPMLRAIERLGFTRCGIVTYESVGKRIAFQLMRPKEPLEGSRVR